MLRTTGCILALLFAGITLHAQTTAIDTSGPDSFYKHFTGTVGDRKIVLDLRYRLSDFSNFGGSTYYFTDDGTINFFLISKPTNLGHIDALRAQAFPENVPMTEIKNVYSVFVQTPRFDFSLSHDSLLGHWVTANGQPYQMTMKESYVDALPFDFTSASDSTVVEVTGRKVSASATYAGIGYPKKMKSDLRSFINKALAEFLGESRSSVSGNDEPSRICIRQFLSELHSAVSRKKEIEGSNLTGQYTLFPVYNDNGFLVLQKGGYQYDFKTKDYTDRNLYLNLDLKNKKVLLLDDVVVVNKEQLTSILEKEFRKKYQLPEGKKLGDLFLEDKMPFTDNFILAPKGLIFSYSPAKLFRDSEDISDLQEMRIFIPFDELGQLLRPDFKKRIGL